MELYVIRHGIAEPLGQGNDFSDEKRALTEDGRSRMREAARGLRKLGIEVDMLLTSPLIRAVETSDIVAAAIGVGKKEVRQTANLAPGASAEALFAEIKAQPGAESIALVGHQPDLGELISRIIQSSAPSIQLKKGAVCCVNVSETVPSLRGDLVWLLTPRQLRLIARA
ncbi:MAG TPA: phosphohistidine phosphatase SixA [Blastocatellia bacterium]|nr:phosphohistidine phosphatase SixA [Blastocatellia bacterium]